MDIVNLLIANNFVNILCDNNTQTQGIHLIMVTFHISSTYRASLNYCTN